MQTSTLLTTVLALAGTALANVGLGVGIAVASATPTAESPLERRQNGIDRSCFSSVLSALGPPTDYPASFTRWASTATQTNAPCTITVPASLSSDIVGYYSDLDEYLQTVDDVADDINTKCGADTVSLTFSEYCRSSVTVLFTSANQTSTTSLKPLDVPTGAIYIGAAPRQTGVLAAAMAVAVALGVVVAL